MATTYERVNQHLYKTINSGGVRVIALSGKWGTGKTYLWKNLETKLKNASSDSPEPIYVSVFGARSAAELKLRIVQAAVVKGGATAKAFQSDAGKLIKTVLGKFIPGAAIDELVLLSVPSLLRDRLVAIDDIERKHKSLDVEEILGFLNEYSENYNAKFLLLLNSDELSDHAVWQTLHEKVIDTEVVLEPTPAEVFSIASANVEFPHLADVQAAVEVIGVTNIRIVARILRVVVTLLAASAPLDSAVLARTIPSTVLLTCLHYRGLKNGLTTDYIVEYNSFKRAFLDKAKTKEESTWDDLLHKLKIRSCDEYEDIVIRYLKTGWLDDQRLKSLLGEYKNAHAENAADLRLNELAKNWFWNPNFGTNDVEAAAQTFTHDVQLLSAQKATNLFDILKEAGLEPLGNQLIGDWVADFLRRAQKLQIEEGSFTHHHQQPHPAILRAYKTVIDEKFPPLTLFEAIMRIRRNSGWGDRERNALENSSVDDYKHVLSTIVGDDLVAFLYENFQLMRTQGLDTTFSESLKRFVSASKQLCAENPTGKLCALITRAYKNNGLVDELN